MNVNLNIELKDWVNPDTKETVQYFDCSAVIMGQKVKFVPKAEDKKLLKFLYEVAQNQNKK